MTTSKLKRFAIPSALVVGGITAGSFLAPIGLVSADDTESDSESTEAESGADNDRDGDGHRHHGRHGRGFAAKAEVLEETLGLSAEEIRDALTDGSSLADVAEAQGVSVDDLTAALVAAATEHIDEAVADGRLDAEQAEERKAGLEDRIADMVTRVRSEVDGHRGRHGGFLRGGLDTVEEALGLSAEEIRAGMAEGKTLADLAGEQGVSVDDLADALVAAATERIDEAVADGKIDEDRAATAKEQLEERIDAAIEAEPFALGRGIGRAEGRGLRSHHRNHHHGADQDADQADA